MWGIAAFVVLALVGVLGVRHFIAQPFHVPSESMEPTLHAGEVILVDRTARARAERGAVVVFDGTGYFASSDESSSGYWVKRVIGTSGDRVSCCTSEGRLSVNGVPLVEPYLASGEAPSEQKFDVRVPEERMFVLGDRRSNSSDSRDHLGDPGGGMIPIERVQGRVTRVVWPMRDWRTLTP